MQQSQLAGGTGDPPQAFPSKGQLIRDFTLPSSSGEPITLSDYRGHSNLVLILVEGAESGNLKILTELAANYGKLREEQAKILGILRCNQARANEIAHEMNLPFPLLADEAGEYFFTPGEHDRNLSPSITMYITDAFGEVFAVYRESQGQSLPDIAEITKWLNLINRQCPECGHPEW